MKKKMPGFNPIPHIWNNVLLHFTNFYVSLAEFFQNLVVFLSFLMEFKSTQGSLSAVNLCVLCDP